MIQGKMPIVDHFICADCDSTYSYGTLEHRLYCLWAPYCAYCDSENIHFVKGDEEQND